jgi:hypothetical protein
MVKVKVSYWDNHGNTYSHTAWGTKDVARYSSGPNSGKIINLGDDMKAAETDAIKKAISYIGIADDIYGGRELTFDDLTTEVKSASAMTQEDYRAMFNKVIKDKGIKWSEVFTILNIKNTSEITDYLKAYQEVKQAKGL